MSKLQMAMPNGRQVHHDGGVGDGAVCMHTIVPQGGLGCWPGGDAVGTTNGQVVSYSCSVRPTGRGGDA